MIYRNIFVLTAAVILLVIEPSSAQIPAEGRAVVVKEIHGVAFHQISGEGGWLPTELKTILSEHDVVKTGENSGATLVFKGKTETTVTMRPESVLHLSTVEKKDGNDDETELFLELGSVLVKAEKLQGNSKFRVRTHRQIVGIRGTEFEVSVD